MHVIADILERHQRHQRGQSDRAIAHDLGLLRVTVRKYRELAEAGQVSAEDPRPTKSGTTISTVLPYQAIVERFLEQGVQVTTIFDRLRGPRLRRQLRLRVAVRPEAPASHAECDGPGAHSARRRGAGRLR